MNKYADLKEFVEEMVDENGLKVIIVTAEDVDGSTHMDSSINNFDLEDLLWATRHLLKTVSKQKGITEDEAVTLVKILTKGDINERTK